MLQLSELAEENFRVKTQQQILRKEFDSLKFHLTKQYRLAEVAQRLSPNKIYHETTTSEQ